MTYNVRILLVDDHDLLRRGLRNYLDRLTNCMVSGEARNAEEAYERMRETPADVVVMDLHLPGEDGIAATARIKANWSKTKVLVLSGQSNDTSMSTDVERAILAGADGFVSKQDGEACLEPAIAALMHGRNYLSPTAATDLVRAIRAAAAPCDETIGLSERETVVLKRIAEGASYKDIATELNVSVKTVDTYRTRLTRKLALSSREDLVRYATSQGLVRVDP